MNDHQILKLARTTLTHDEFSVWFAKHYHTYGRRAGSLALGITQEAWRWREAKAERKMADAIAHALDETA